MVDRNDEIKAKVEETFMRKYPSTSENNKEHLKCFVGFCVEETIKEMNDGK